MRIVKEVNLVEDDLKRYRAAQSDLFRAEKMITDKIDDVFWAILAAFEYTDDFNWWFNNAREGAIGEPCIEEDRVMDYSLELKKSSSLRPETSNWSYTESFPLEYLFMSRQDIIASVRNEMAADQIKEAERKALAQKRNAKSDKVKAAALNKLSAEEKRVLGLK